MARRKKKQGLLTQISNTLSELLGISKKVQAIILRIAGIVLAIYFLISVIKIESDDDLPVVDTLKYVGDSLEVLLKKEKKENPRPPISPSLYNKPKTLEYEFLLNLKDSAIVTQFIEQRIQVFPDAVKQLNNSFVLPIDPNKLQASQQRAYQKGELLNYAENTDQLIHIYEQDVEVIRETYDSINGYVRVRYKLQLATPIVSEHLMPGDLRAFLDQFINKSEEFNKLNDFSDNMQIDLGTVYTQISRHPEFQKELEILLNKYQHYFQMVDFGVPFLKNSSFEVFFNRGEFRIDGFNLYIINNIIKRFSSHIQGNSEKSFKLSCIGYTDSISINTPIKYTGNARWLGRRGYITLSKSEGNEIRPEITNNPELSFARAFHGLEITKRLLEEQLKSSEVNIQYLYEGAGVDPTYSRDNPNKRRIELRLRTE